MPFIEGYSIRRGINSRGDEGFGIEGLAAIHM